jgi:CheY-like chemotaxis protein
MAQQKYIMIVEDEEALLESYSEIILSQGYSVLKMKDGYEALAALEKNHSVALIFLDLMMPGMDGLEVLETIKSDKNKYGEMPVIILTNMVSERVVREAFTLGAKSYLVKTEIAFEDLINEVKKNVQ